MTKEQLRAAIRKTIENMDIAMVMDVVDGGEEAKFETPEKYLDYAADEMATDAMLNDINQNMSYLYQLEAGYVTDDYKNDKSITDAIHRDENNLPSDARADILPKVTDKKCACVGLSGYGMTGFGETDYSCVYLSYIDEDGHLFTVQSHRFDVNGVSIILNQPYTDDDDDYYSFDFEGTFMPEGYRELFEI